MKNLKISKKLAVISIILCVLAVMVGLVGILGMNSIRNADESLYNHELLAIAAIGEIRENLQQQRVLLRSFIIYSGDNENTKKTADSFAALETAMDGLFEKYEATIDDESHESAYYSAKETYYSDFATVKERVKAESERSFEAGYDVLFAPSAASMINTIVSDFSSAMETGKTQADTAVNSNASLFMKMTIVEMGVIVLSCLIAIFFSFYVSRLISRPITIMTEYFKKVARTGDMALSQEDEANIAECAKVKDETGVCISSAAAFVNRLLGIGKVLEEVAAGDLTAEVALLSDSDTMGTSLRKMISNLNGMFGEINNVTGQVSTGSKQVSDGSQSLAEGSTEQAAAVEQLSSSIADVSEKTKENAKMAEKASELAGIIKRNAETGSTQMEQMMSAVHGIQEASQDISKVIKVIDDIAFQTNILALNAAVEAARAGQHGKGFAVVAEEVRNLAAKSAEAAKDTESLIANSMEKSELGARIAAETAESLYGIVTGINESSKIVSEIAKSSDEQAAAIGQINSGIEQVAQVVQINCATAEESASASEEMSQLAGILDGLVEQFKLKSSVKSRPVASSAPMAGGAVKPSVQASGGANIGKY